MRARRPDDVRASGLFGIVIDQARRQSGWGRGIEDSAHRQLDTEFRTDLRDQPSRQQRMATQREERVFGAHSLPAEQLGEDRTHPALRGRRRLAVTVHRDGGWRWQRPLVEFAAHGQRDLGNHRKRTGHHVFRQHRRGMRAYLVEIQV